MLVLASRLEARSFERFMQILARHNCIGVLMRRIEVREESDPDPSSDNRQALE